jgi:hypothetical protein
VKINKNERRGPAAAPFLFGDTGDSVKTSGMDISNDKKRGHWAELRFMAKAAELGFQLNQPLGDTAQYDVVIDLGGHFVRVQVKSTYFQASNLKPGNFVASLVRPSGPNHRYQQSDFDYLAVYCIPRDIWYIIPWAVAYCKQSICVCPGDKQNKWEHYREAWYLLYDRAPAPLLKRGCIDLYGIIEDYVPPPRVRRQKSRMPRSKRTLPGHDTSKRLSSRSK